MGKELFARKSSSFFNGMAAALQRVDSKVSDCEQLKRIAMVSTPWLMENGFLTPATKIRRDRIKAAADPQLEKWVAANGPVVWQ